jgi:hypothetical protein
MPAKDMRFDVVDYIIFALLLLFSAAIGLFYGFIDKRKQKKKNADGSGNEPAKSSAQEYLLGNKSMGVSALNNHGMHRIPSTNLDFPDSDEFAC